MSSYEFPKKTVRDIEVHGKRIMLRADFNVPISKKDGSISSDYRIVQTLPTINYLLDRGCEVVVVSHLGRPEGEKNLKFTLEPVGIRLAELLKKPVNFIPDCINDAAVQAMKHIKPASVTLLENVRFYPGEETNDADFAAKLIRVIRPDFIVHDEFGVIHRAHASTEGISHLVPAVAGLLLEKEVTTLTRAIENPDRPLVAVLGGAKISDKLPLVERFLETADTVLVGGAMANNFIKQSGHGVGKSLIDTEGAEQVSLIVSKAKSGQLIIPKDVAVGTELSSNTKRRDYSVSAVGADDIILNIGFETMREYNNVLANAATVIWNGTLGMTELPQFAQGSETVAQALSDKADSLASIIGGGDTADFVLDWLDKNPGHSFTHISTGGGASLELLSGLKLPGVEALLDK